MNNIQYWPAMPPGRCSHGNCNSPQLDCNTCHSRDFLHLRVAPREARQERPRQSVTVRSSADSAAAGARRSEPAETTHGVPLSQYSQRPIRTPKSEDPQQLPAHRRVGLQIHPARAQPKLAPAAPKYQSPGNRQEGSKPAAGSHQLQDLKHSRYAAPTSGEHSNRALVHSRNAMQSPGHPLLQPYWSDLESGTLQGESMARSLLAAYLWKAAHFLVGTI